MSHAALLSGIALAISGLGMAHGVAAAMGIHCRVPHGLACAVMLPSALRFNASVCQAEIAELGRQVLDVDRKSSACEVVDRFLCEIESLCRRVGVPRHLSSLGVKPEQIPLLVKSSRGNSMNGNPRDVSDAELTRILEELL
jgi:alcohol dehydrogenase class IV